MAKHTNPDYDTLEERNMDREPPSFIRKAQASFPKRQLPQAPQLPAVQTAYDDVLEQVRALAVKASDTFGNKVREEVQAVVRGHLETALKCAARYKEIDDHYVSDMKALEKDVNEFTAYARSDLEKLNGLTPSRSAADLTEVVKQRLDEELNGEAEQATPPAA